MIRQIEDYLETHVKNISKEKMTVPVISPLCKLFPQTPNYRTRKLKAGLKAAPEEFLLVTDYHRSRKYYIAQFSPTRL